LGCLQASSPGKSPRDHVVLHLGAFLQFVPDGVRVIGIGSLEKLLEVFSGLSRLALEIALSSSDELLVRVTNILVVVALIAAGGDRDSLGLPFRPPFFLFWRPLCALVVCLGWHSSTAIGGRFPAALNKNGPGHLISRGVPGGNVEELIRDLWLVMSELMHQGLTVCVRPER
jgi:hypothetical protein